MAIVGKFGKLDLFITITYHPSWNEIKNNLYLGQQASNRFDNVASVFKLKLVELLKDILQNDIFGSATAYCYSIEFQKRGLPHVNSAKKKLTLCHILPERRGWVNRTTCSVSNHFK